MRAQARSAAIALGVGFVGVGLLYACSRAPEEREERAAAPLVRVEVAQPGDLQLFVDASGTVVPRSETQLVPQVSGEVVWVAPAMVSGGFFSRDDVLVRIDPADYEAALESARAAVARAESEQRRAAKERDRQRRLADRSVASQSRIDDAETAFRVADAVLREARASLARAQRDLERTELHAPYDGRVRSEQVDVGQFAQRGAALASLYAVDFAEVRLPLPDRELAYLEVPLLPVPAEALVEGDSSAAPRVLLHAVFAGRRHEWQGHVVRTEGEIDPKSRMVTVVARVADPYARSSGGDATPLAVGLFVEARIDGRRLEGAYVLPREALRDGDRVYVVDDEGRLRFRPVHIVRKERERVIVDAGLVPGERICTSPLAAALDGMRVRVLDERAEAAAPASVEPAS